MDLEQRIKLSLTNALSNVRKHQSWNKSAGLPLLAGWTGSKKPKNEREAAILISSNKFPESEVRKVAKKHPEIFK